MNNTESSFLKYGGVNVDQRKMKAVRAYFEWVRSTKLYGVKADDEG